MATEQENDRAGIRMTREERKALRLAGFRLASVEVRQAAAVRAQKAIAHLEAARSIQQANGIVVTDAQHAKNVASHVLTLECLSEI